MSNVQTAVWALRRPCCLRASVNGYYQMPIRKGKKGSVGTTDQTPLETPLPFKQRTFEWQLSLLARYAVLGHLNMQNNICLLTSGEAREEALLMADAAANLLKPQSPGLLTL